MWAATSVETDTSQRRLPGPKRINPIDFGEVKLFLYLVTYSHNFGVPQCIYFLLSMNPNDFGDPLTFPLIRLSFLVFIEKAELLDECHLVDILGSQKISKNMITTFDPESSGQTFQYCSMPKPMRFTLSSLSFKLIS